MLTHKIEDNTMSTIKEKDIVKFQYLSNSPKMFVEAIIDNNSAKCFWFDKQDAPQTKIFELETLAKILPTNFGGSSSSKSRKPNSPDDFMAV